MFVLASLKESKKQQHKLPDHHTLQLVCNWLCLWCLRDKYGHYIIMLIFQVTEDEKVSTVKQLVSERLNIPANQQRLLYKGKALAGTSAFSQVFYNLCA